MRLLSLPLVVVLAACGTGQAGPSSAPATAATSHAEVDPAPPRPPAPAEVASSKHPDEAGCGLAKASAFVGRKATPALRIEVAAAVGRRAIRWIGPGDIVTMDYSESRLNMRLDAEGTIVAAKCG